MGGLFSCDSEENPPKAQPADSQTPTPTASRVSPSIGSYPSYYHQSVRLPTPHAIAAVAPSTASQLSSVQHVPSYRPTTTPSCPRVLPITVATLPLKPAVYEDPAAYEWDVSPLPHAESFRLVNVSEHENDFSAVKEAFCDGAKRKNFKITKVERVENPFLLGCYLLKKEEMEKRYGFVDEEVHFHGTKKCNVKQICENNFNWRLHGGSTGNRYGKGVSFSPISYYASHYSDKSDTDKVMFYVRVLVSNSVIGNGNMALPPKLDHFSNSCYDTAEKENGSVIVKFSDNEFYPEFIIHYKTPAVLTQPQLRHQSRRVNYTPQPTYRCAGDDYYYEDY